MSAQSEEQGAPTRDSARLQDDQELTARPHIAQADDPEPYWSRAQAQLAKLKREKDKLSTVDNLTDAYRRGVYSGIAAMASGRYFERLRKLTNQFDTAFAERNTANAYTWAFVHDYNFGELRWLYEQQTLLYGSHSARCALLRRELVKRGIAVTTQNY